MSGDVERAVAALNKNGFEAFRAKDRAEARTIFWENIYSKAQPRSASWGDSITLAALGIVEELEARPGVELLRTFGPGLSWDEKIERRRQALLTDLFMTGSNAVTEDGKIVNLDMIGNRTGAIVFGPKSVVIFVGRNKIVPDVEAAVKRIKTVAAPLNAKRHTSFRTPCQTTGVCMDCSSPDRICNSWSIVEKCFPKGRIRVVIVDEDLGL
jgi:L-lactate utilization protein LutB